MANFIVASPRLLVARVSFSIDLHRSSCPFTSCGGRSLVFIANLLFPSPFSPLWGCF